jgi:serine/threonine-protein kinase
MSEPPATHDPTLPVALLPRVGAVCQRFEAAWQSGPRPRIEDYLDDVPRLDRRALLRELIPLDVEYRRGHGEAPRPEDYAGRFPGLDSAWLADVAAGSAAAGADRPPARPATPPPPPVAGHVYSVRCPHCHNPIHLVDDRPDEVLCPGCGSSFHVRDTRPTTTLSGTRPLGKFQLLERVGLGAFGAVWRARDTVLDWVVALKVPYTGLLTAAV